MLEDEDEDIAACCLILLLPALVRRRDVWDFDLAMVRGILQVRSLAVATTVAL